MRRTVAVAATSAALLLAGAAPALATYPGTNGAVYYDDPAVEGTDNVPCIPTYDSDFAGDDGQGELDGNAAVSADHKRVAASVDYNIQNFADVYVANITGACGLVYLDGPSEMGTGVTFSHDGSKVVTVSGFGDADDGDGGLQIFDSRTGDELNEDLTSFGFDPSWDPKANTIAYSYTDGLYTVPSAGGTPKVFVKGAGISWPDYSPDGTKIAYEQSGMLKYVTVATKKVTTTSVKVDDGALSWSPDGKDLVIQSTTNKQCAEVTTAGKVVAHVGPTNGCTPLGWAAK